MSQITLLAQVIKLLPRDTFKKLVAKHKADKHNKGIDSWDHLVSMLYCHLAGASSLRDISNGLRSTLGNRSHMGLGSVPSKSSLSYINQKRPWQLFSDYYFTLFDALRADGLPKRHGLRNIKRKVLLLDASVISVCLNLFNWAHYRAQKGGLKVHTVLDYDGLLPTFCALTDGKTHEIKVARSLFYPKGSVLVFDRGYTDFSWWHDLDSRGIFFITRTKTNLDYRIRAENAIPHPMRHCIKGDYMVDIQSPAARRAGFTTARLIRYFDPTEQREFTFITNQTIWTAADIATAYKERWHIEVFFKFLKQHLHIKSFVGTSHNAVMIQLWTALICFLLLKYLQHKATYKWCMSNLSNFLRLASFAKINLFQWLNYPFEIEKKPPKGQLKLKFSQ